MEDNRTMLEKLTAGEISVRDCNWDADFDHDEICALLDEHVIEPRQLPESVASDMIIAGRLDYEEYPFEDFSPYEQLRQLENEAISSEDFWKKIKVDDFYGQDLLDLQQHAKECGVSIPGEEKKHE